MRSSKRISQRAFCIFYTVFPVVPVPVTVDHALAADAADREEGGGYVRHLAPGAGTRVRDFWALLYACDEFRDLRAVLAQIGAV